jgi:acetyl esterase/lipase
MSSAQLQTILERLRAGANYSPVFSVAEARVSWYAYSDHFVIPDRFVVERGMVGERILEWVRRREVTDRRILLYLHGGGYVCGSAASHRPIACALAEAFDGVVASLDYRLAPEHPFPAALDDTLSAYDHLLATGWRPAQIAIGGESAGAGLAVASLLALRDRGGPLPGAAICISPWSDLTNSGESVASKAESDPIVFRGAIDITSELYRAGHSASDPLLSPIFGSLRSLPPLLIQVGSNEILLDDAVRLARAAGLADVAVELEIWPKMIHAWHFFAAELDEGRHASERAARWLNDKLAAC